MSQSMRHVYSLLPAATIDSVLAFLQQHEGASVSAIKSGTGDRFDYGDSGMVVAHHLRHSAA